MTPARAARTPSVTKRIPKPRTSTRRKRDQLLAKAAALIARKGYEAMSMRDLSSALGVSLAGMYHYFRSKEDLLFQLQHESFKALLAQQQEIAAQRATPEERLRSLIVGHLAFYANHTNELKVCTFEMESLGGALYEEVQELRRRYYRVMTAAVSAIMDGPGGSRPPSRRSLNAALFTFGMLNWIFMWYDPARHGSMRQIGDEMYALVYQGLGNGRRKT